MIYKHSSSRLELTAGMTVLEALLSIALLSCFSVAFFISYPPKKPFNFVIAGHEAEAISALQQLVSAETKVKNQKSIDTNGNGIGEYAYFSELTGVDPVRIKNGLQKPGDGTSKDRLGVPLMPCSFGVITNDGQVIYDGYYFQIYLPMSMTFGNCAQREMCGLREHDSFLDGMIDKPFPDPINCETVWCAYAWPISEHTGTRAFFVNQEGIMLETENSSTNSYIGPHAPPFDAAFASPRRNMASHLPQEGAASNDGHIWERVH